MGEWRPLANAGEAMPDGGAEFTIELPDEPPPTGGAAGVLRDPGD